MSNNQLRREMLVGVVFAVAVGVALLGTVAVSGFQLFRPTETWRVRLDRIGGLEEGDEVWIRGYPMGIVDEIRFSRQDYAFWLTLKMDRDAPIFEGYDIRIGEQSALGGRFLKIDPGPATEPADKQNLVGKGSEGDVMSRIADVLGKLEEPITEVSEGRGSIGKLIFEDELYRDLREATSSLRTVADRLEKGEGSVGRLLTRDEFYDDLKAASGSVRTVAERLEQGRGTAGKILADDKLYRDLEQLVGSLNVVAARLEEKQGTAGKLIGDDTLHNDLAELIRRLKDGKGAIARLLRDDSGAIVDDLRASTTHLRSVARKLDEGSGTLGALINERGLYENADAAVADVRDGKGTLGRLFTDDSLYNNANEAAENLKAAATKAHTGDGTLARLLNDPEVYQKVKQLLGRAIASIENARDSAPLSAITSFLTGPF
ncbi:MAG: MlaD family protein [Planctomycetota bacterium]